MVANIEVFMFSKDGVKHRADLPDWSDDHPINHQNKELYYEQQCLPLIAIEAEVYRQHGLGINWALDDFINYAQINNIQFLSQLQEKAQDLYNLNKIKGLRKQVRFKFDELYARRSIAYKEERGLLKMSGQIAFDRELSKDLNMNMRTKKVFSQQIRLIQYCKAMELHGLSLLTVEKLMIFGLGRLQSNLYALITSNQKQSFQGIQRKVASGASSENLRQPPVADILSGLIGAIF